MAILKAGQTNPEAPCSVLAELPQLPLESAGGLRKDQGRAGEQPGLEKCDGLEKEDSEPRCPQGGFHKMPSD